MLDHYPKTRKPLPLEFQKIYKKHTFENRSGSTNASGLGSKMESWMHRQVAKDIAGLSHSPRTLEIGAGGLNHIGYEPNIGDYDVVEPCQDLMENSPLKKKINNIYQEVFAISNEEQYKRIISIAVLEHLEDLPRIIAKCGLLLHPDGCFRAGIPNEGTLLWKMGYRLTTGLEFKFRYKLSYDVLMKHEHINNAQEIEDVLKYFFNDVSCRIFGISKNLAFYRFYECRNPTKEKCRAYLKPGEA